MIFLTHGFFALFLGLLFQKIFSYQDVFFLALAIFFSLLPDIDSSASFMGKKVKIIGFFFKHRGFFHSFLFLVFATVIILIASNNIYYSFATAIGIFSHIFLDALTPAGVEFFWPNKKKLKGPLQTGSSLDFVLLVVFVVLGYFLARNIYF
jgi:inner membrane protein